MADHSGDEGDKDKEYFDPEEEVKVSSSVKVNLK